MNSKDKQQVGNAPLKSRWSNLEQVQGVFLQTYFCPVQEKEFLATKVPTLDWIDYVLEADGSEYTGCLVVVDKDVSCLLESPDFVTSKKEFLAISSKYIDEIERLKTALAEAQANTTKTTKTKGPRKSRTPGVDADGFPKFVGKPGKLNSNTPASKEARHQWRNRVKEYGGINTMVFKQYARKYMNSPKSIGALEHADQFNKWNAMVDACADYDSKH